MKAKLLNYLNIVYDLSYRATIKPLCNPAKKIELKGQTAQGNALTLVYFGDKTALAYISAQLFADEPSIISEETCSMIDIVRGKYHCDSGDLVLVDLDFPFNRLSAPAPICLPYWIKQSIGLQGTWDEYLAKLRRKTRREAQRMIRKFDLTTSIVSGEEYAEAFYDELYQPYIASRHGDASIIITRDTFLKKAKASDIIRLHYDDRIIAAAQLVLSGESLSIGWTGLNTEDDKADLRGAADALDYFCMQHAFESGCSSVDMGHSRPSLIDGILRYKKKWGADVRAGIVPQGTISLYFRTLSDASKEILSQQGLISQRGRDLIASGLILARDEPAKIISRIEDSAPQGLHGAELYVPNDKVEECRSESINLILRPYGSDEELLSLINGTDLALPLIESTPLETVTAANDAQEPSSTKLQMEA